MAAWSASGDAQLNALVALHGRNWKAISRATGRSREAVRHHHRRLHEGDGSGGSDDDGSAADDDDDGSAADDEAASADGDGDHSIFWSPAEDAKLMVGSEIEQAIETAMTESYHANKPGLDEGILSQELKKKPRIFKTLADELKEVLDWVGFDPETGDGIRARFASDTKGEGFRAHQVNG